MPDPETAVKMRNVATNRLVAEVAYPLLRLDSGRCRRRVLNNFEVVVWGIPAIPPEILANLHEDRLYRLGNHPSSAIAMQITECRGVLGADFLWNCTVLAGFRGRNASA